MKKVLLTFSLLLVTCILLAQDFIYRNNGKEIQAKVIEITIDLIKFRKFDFLDGPIYNISKSDVFMIVYENGQREVFQNADEPPPVVEDPPEIPKNEEIKTEIPHQPKVLDIPEETKAPDQEKELLRTPASEEQIRSKFSLGISAGITGATGIYDYKVGPNPPVESVRPAPMGGVLVGYEPFKWLFLQSGLYYKGKGDQIDVGEWARSFEFPQGVSIDITADGEGSITNTIGYLEWHLVPNFILSPNKPNKWMLGVGGYLGMGLHGKEKKDYTIFYYYDFYTSENDVVLEDRDIEFVNLFPTDNDPQKKYVNRFDYGLYFNLGIDFGNYQIGGSATLGLNDLEPDMDTFFGSSPNLSSTRNLTGSLYFTYYLMRK